MERDTTPDLLRITETFAAMREAARDRRVVLILPNGEIVDTESEDEPPAN